MSRARLCLLLLLLPAAAPVAADDAPPRLEVAVIAHPDVTQDSLSKSQLLDFYTGDLRRWPDGGPVLLMDLKSRGPVRDAFFRFLGKRPSRMKSIWLRNMLSGEAAPPEALPSEADVVRAVAATPGALGYVGRGHATDEVRILLVIADEGAAPEGAAPEGAAPEGER